MTAQNNEEARIDSYMAGADSYITKPFDRKVLLARVENLLNSSKLCRKKFKTVKETDLKSIAFRDSDQLFLNRVIECIETHLSDSDFDLDFIVSQLGVSKSTFNRKIRAITDMTPMDFVKNIKMKFACKLLRNKDFNISEVAYEVGFSNPKYFATCFKEEFGMTPTEFQSKEPADVKN